MWNPHLFEFLGPWFLSLAETIISLFSLLKTTDHLFVVGVSLPVLQLLVVFCHKCSFHLHVELAHLLCLSAQSSPRSLQRPILRTWGKSWLQRSVKSRYENIYQCIVSRFIVSKCWIWIFLPFSMSCRQRLPHSVSCWAYAFSIRARSWRQFMRSPQRRFPSSTRFTVRL